MRSIKSARSGTNAPVSSQNTQWHDKSRSGFVLCPHRRYRRHCGRAIDALGARANTRNNQYLRGKARVLEF